VPVTNRQILLAALPKERLEPSNFSTVDAPDPEPGVGEVLCRTRYLSIDAANRAWMQGATYTAALVDGQVMAGGTLGEVVASNDPGFAAGDIVAGAWGWQEQAAVPAELLEKLAPRGPLSNELSVYGTTGLTAYFGLLDVIGPVAGETLVVSAAAGAVGNVVCQIGKARGCRVVGVAGGPEKCAWLTERLGLDAAVDYKADGFFRALKAACPDGIDGYFDNVGGDVLGAALFQMNLHGRISCCGVVSQYDTGNPAPGPRGIPGLLVTKRVRMEGFIVMDFYDRKTEALEDLHRMVGAGEIAVFEDVMEGLDAAPEALIDLLHGGNVGKRMVRVLPDAA
jgi:NADPH-dependent curcumin reductase CurA